MANIKPTKSKKLRTTIATGDHNHFTQWFTLIVDKPADDFVIRKEEVERVQWFTRAELERELREHPERYLKGLRWALEHL